MEGARKNNNFPTEKKCTLALSERNYFLGLK